MTVFRVLDICLYYCWKLESCMDLLKLVSIKPKVVLEMFIPHSNQVVKAVWGDQNLVGLSDVKDVVTGSNNQDKGCELQ